MKSLTDQESKFLQELLEEKLKEKNLSKFYTKIILNLLQKLNENSTL